jgi:hypothetical protein
VIRQRTLRLAWDRLGQIKAVVGPGDSVGDVEIPLMYRALVGNELARALEQIPTNYIVHVDSAGPVLWPVLSMKG